MLESDRKQIPLRVFESQKQDWERYKEELGFGSRETMIRRAVEYFHATQTGSCNDELAEEVSTQLDGINRKLVNLQAEVSKMHSEQLDRDDIPDIAEEIEYTLSESQVLDYYSEIDLDDIVDNPEDYADEPFVDGLTETLAQIGFIGPDDKRNEINRHLAVEFLLRGFSLATKAVRDPVERTRLEDLNDELRDELVSLL